MKLFRTTDTIMVCVMIAAAAFTYKAKHDAEGKLAEMRAVERSIRFEQETIDVLKADWSLMTQPSRLQKLAETYAAELELQPVEPTQIGTFDDLPARPLDIETLIEGTPGATAALATPDMRTTGAVRP